MIFFSRLFNRLKRNTSVQILLGALRSYQQHNGSILARGVAFSLLVSSIPFLFITLYISSYISSMLLADPVITELLQEKIGSFVPPEVATMLLTQINTFMESNHWGAIGIVGLVVLLWTPQNLYASLSASLASLMDPPKVHPFFWQQLRNFMAHFLSIFLLFFFSFVVLILRSIPYEAMVFPGHERFLLVFDFLQVLTSRALVTAVIMLTLAGIYRMSYNAPIQRRFLFGVSLVVALVWQVINALGASVIGASARNEVVYGVLAGAIIMMLWAYLFAQMVLFGGALLAQLQQRYIKKKQRANKRIRTRKS